MRSGEGFRSDPFSYRCTELGLVTLQRVNAAAAPGESPDGPPNPEQRAAAVAPPSESELAAARSGQEQNAAAAPAAVERAKIQRAKITSRYRGVSCNTTGRRWKAVVEAGGKQHTLGYFSDEAEAARAVDRAALHYRGA